MPPEDRLHRLHRRVSRRKQPAYCRQKAARPTHRDRAFVELDGARIYLGEYGSPESKEAYARVLAEWYASRKESPAKPALTITELISRFWTYGEEYYRKPDGRPTGELDYFRQALNPLKSLYGSTLASEFGPRALRAVREWMIDADRARTYINASIGRIKRMFKWAVAEELIEPSVFHGLQCVGGLRRGRSRAREGRTVKPVPESHIEAIREYVSRQVWAMVQLQLRTGARSGEIIPMRAVDIDMGGEIWEYTPESHKTEHHGHRRVIYLGPSSQRVLRPFLEDRPLTAYLFSPKEAEKERLARRHAKRTTPLNQGNRPGKRRASSPRRPPRDAYDINTYRRAIGRGCDLAGVPSWHPHQLRHNAGTYLRKEFGLEVARIILGHRSVVITDHYAEVDRERALEVIREFG